MATYRLVLDITLDVDDDKHAEECAETLWDDGPKLGSNWEDLNPQIVVSEVEHTS